MPETMSFLVPPEADGERLDKWLSRQDSLGLTRSSLQNRMEHGDVTGSTAEPSPKTIGKRQEIRFL